MSQYDEHDIKAIINRAAELQQRSAGMESLDKDAKKLSLDEIEEVAKEAGVSPDYVREAALEYEGIPVEEPLFLDTGNNHEIEILGYARGNLTKKTWAELRSIIEYHFDSPGKVVRRPEGVVWDAKPKGIMKYLASRKSPKVEVKNEGSRTSIRIKKSIKTTRKLYLPALASLAIALFFFFMILTGEDPELLFIGLFFFLPVAETFRRWTRKRIEKERDSLENLVQKLQTIITRRFKAGKNRKEKPQIEAPGEDEQINIDREQERGAEQKNSRGKNRTNT